jgi:molecular chaperone GrpE
MTTENDQNAAEPENSESNGVAGAEPVQAAQEPEVVKGEAEENAPEPTLEEQLSAALDEAKRNYDSYLRSQAELQNVLKRHERELGERSRYEGERLAKELLGVVDDLERALEHAGETGEGLVDGLQLVLKSLLTALENHGVERLESVGETFDPALHEAVAMVESTEHPAGSVMEQHRPGYRLRDRLLRAAMVVVAKAPAPKEEEK